ncbi:histone-lysine N-methyltransferase 2C isoform X1, partial [Tachysurus ichikawai]
MSSEDKSVNPSEQGPSPLQSSAGATPSGSPAPADRHVRGRPHRDSVNSAPTSRHTRKY